jgi:hypothetical protein
LGTSVKEKEDMTEKTYRRPTIRGWLLPSSLGPFIASYVAAILTAFFGPVDGHFRWVVLAVGIAIATVWSFLYVLIAALVDVALLSIRVRALPNGKYAWLQSFAAPAASLAVYAVYPPHKWWALGPWAVAVALLVPPVIAILASRIALGSKPSAK